MPGKSAADAAGSAPTAGAQGHDKREAWEQIVPIPPDAPTPPKDAQLGEPTYRWPYHTADGALCGYICQWVVKNGHVEQRTKPLIWASRGGKSPRWTYFGAFKAPVPLYDLHLLSAAPQAPVLLVQGEGAADAAKQLAPDGWCVTTARAKADLGVLKDRLVVVWPTNSGAGVKYASEWLTAITAVTKTVRMAHIGPLKLPEGWDLACPLPESVTLEQLRGALEPPPPTALEPATPPPKQPADDRFDDFLKFRPVGYWDKNYYFQKEHLGDVLKLSPNECCRQDSLLALYPNQAYWEGRFGHGKVDWHKLGADLMAACQRAGFYSGDRVRGRGAWIDAGRVVVHLGDQLIVDGKPKKLVAIESHHVYPAAVESLGRADVEPLPTTEAMKLLRIARQMNWRNPLYAELFCGWIVTAMICGALRWRAHIWITGAAGVGKTWIAEKVLVPILGRLPLYAFGKSSSSGYTQHLRTDARPVICDEAEAKGRKGEERREEILELMRLATSEGPWRVLKGTAQHDGVAFKVKSSFCLISIGANLKSIADIGRTAVLSLDAPPNLTPEQKKYQEERFAKVSREVAELPDDFGARLFARAVNLVPVVRETTDVFAKVFSEKFGSRRVGDLIGTFLAGLWALHNDVAISPAQARAFVDKHDWSEFSTANTMKEEHSVINHLMAVRLSAANQSGARFELSVGELCALAMGLESSGRVTQDEAYLTLLRAGIRWDKRLELNSRLRPPAGKSERDPGLATSVTGGFLFSHGHPDLRRLMIETEYGEGWIGVLGRHPLARVSRGSLSFSKGFSSQATWIPAKVLIGTPDEPREAPPPPAEEEIPFDDPFEIKG